jgi:hypothetical protein
MPSVLDVVPVIRKLSHMLEIITISDANIVGMNGLKAGIQVWQKKTKQADSKFCAKCRMVLTYHKNLHISQIAYYN